MGSKTDNGRQRHDVYKQYFESGLEVIRIEYETHKSRKNTNKSIHCRISWKRTGNNETYL